MEGKSAKNSCSAGEMYRSCEFPLNLTLWVGEGVEGESVASRAFA